MRIRLVLILLALLCCGGAFAADRDAANIVFAQAQTAVQAAAAADNLLKGLRGETPTATFKVELICIIDAIDHGTLVFRNTRRQIILPSSRLFHWAKRFFEGVYLRKYR